MIEVGQIINGWKVTRIDRRVYDLENNGAKAVIYTTFSDLWACKIQGPTYNIVPNAGFRADTQEEVFHQATQWANGALYLITTEGIKQ